MMLTEQRLQSDSYNFPGGVILFIEELIKKFKSQVGGKKSKLIILK